MDEESTVIRSLADGVASITLNNPKSGNALTRSIYEALVDTWQWVEENSDIKAVTFTASGDRFFCTGADVSSLKEQGTLRKPGEDWRLTWRMAGVTKPVIVAVNGTVAGGGLGFVTDGTVVVASRNAKFMDTHVSVGQICGYGALRLVSIIGPSEAARIALAGGRLTSERAHALGLVNELCETADDARECARALALNIAKSSPKAVARTSELLRAITVASHEGNALLAADKAIDEHMSHPDATEGPRAWVEKRTAQWQPL